MSEIKLTSEDIKILSLKSELFNNLEQEDTVFKSDIKGITESDHAEVLSALIIGEGDSDKMKPYLELSRFYQAPGILLDAFKLEYPVMFWRELYKHRNLFDGYSHELQFYMGRLQTKEELFVRVEKSDLLNDLRTQHYSLIYEITTLTDKLNSDVFTRMSSRQIMSYDDQIDLVDILIFFNSINGDIEKFEINTPFTGNLKFFENIYYVDDEILYEVLDILRDGDISKDDFILSVLDLKNVFDTESLSDTMADIMNSIWRHSVAKVTTKTGFNPPDMFKAEFEGEVITMYKIKVFDDTNYSFYMVPNTFAEPGVRFYTDILNKYSKVQVKQENVEIYKGYFTQIDIINEEA